MSVITELKERREFSLNHRRNRLAKIEEHQRMVAVYDSEIADLDRAIAALSPAPPTVSDREEEGGLLESQPEPIPTEVRKQDEQDAARPETKAFVRDVLENTFGQQTTDEQVEEVAQKIDALAPPPAQEAPAIPEGGTQESELTEFLQKDGAVEHSGGPCPVPSNWVVEVLTRGCGIWPLKNIDQIGAIWWWEGEEAHPTDIVAYRIIKASADAERIEDARDGTPSTEQTEHDRPKLTNEEWDNAPKFDDVPPNAAFIAEAELAINDKSEDEPVTTEQLEAAGITEPGASEMAAMRMAPETQDKKFDPFKLFRTREPA